MGIFGKNFFEVVENGTKLILPDRLGIWDVKNHTFSHCLLRLAKNTLVVNRPLINIPMFGFTSLEITQEVSALSLSKINRLGGFLFKK